MSFSPNTRIGGYEILGPLGAGGMGEVYRARDVRLHREVAIKVLPSVFAADPERLARFEREAQVLASLNHPNIAHIHGVEESGGILALVMELVDGESLAARLARGPVASTEALEFARQIADALEAAHQRGIVHRDLKPANILLRPDGTVKVLDFGLAKAQGATVGADAANSPTFTLGATEQGMILGTAAYMAPEQAKGRPVDTRADVWAFGVVLFEMLAGRSLYSGESASEILARVIEREPDWSRLPAATSAGVRRLLRRCLTKDPKHRLQSIGDARLEIEEALEPSAVNTDTRVLPARANNRMWPAIAVMAILAAGVLGVLLLRAPAALPEQPPVRAAIALPDGLYLDGVGSPEVAVSRDGSTLAFLARNSTGPQQLYVRRLDHASASLVPGSETAEGPFFSPDGRWVAFAVGVSVLSGVPPPELRKYSLDTGLTQTICVLDDFFGGVWRDDGSILFVNAQPQGVWTVPAGGGRQHPLVSKFRADGKETQRSVAWPELLPDGQSVLLTDWENGGIGELAIVDLASGELTRLGLSGAGARFFAGGYLVYADARAALMGAAFDARSRRVQGRPVALLQDIALSRGNVPVFAASRNGTLVYATGYLSGSRREPMRLVRAAPNGQVTMLPFEPDLFGRALTVSTDGSRLATTTWGGSQWVLDLLRGTRIKLPSAGITDVHSLAISPDRARVASTGPAQDGRWGAFVQNADGTGASEKWVEVPEAEIFVAGWTPDGRTLVTWGQSPDRINSRISRIDRGAPPRVVFDEQGAILSASVSPDGEWLAYDSTGAGDIQVYARSLSGNGGRVAVTASGGLAPQWAHDGRQILFRRRRSVMAVDVARDGTGIHFGQERKLFDWDAVPREYAVGPRGEFYAFFPVPGVTQQTSLQLRTGWFGEVEKLVRGH